MSKNIIKISIINKQYRYDHTNPFSSHQIIEAVAMFNDEILKNQTCSSVDWIRHDFDTPNAHEKYRKRFPCRNYELQFVI